MDEEAAASVVASLHLSGCKRTFTGMNSENKTDNDSKNNNNNNKDNNDCKCISSISSFDMDLSGDTNLGAHSNNSHSQTVNNHQKQDQIMKKDSVSEQPKKYLKVTTLNNSLESQACQATTSLPFGDSQHHQTKNQTMILPSSTFPSTASAQPVNGYTGNLSAASPSIGNNGNISTLPSLLPSRIENKTDHNASSKNNNVFHHNMMTLPPTTTIGKNNQGIIVNPNSASPEFGSAASVPISNLNNNNNNNNNHQCHLKHQLSNTANQSNNNNHHQSNEKNYPSSSTTITTTTTASSIKGRTLRPFPFFYYQDHSQDIDDDPFTPITPLARVPNFPAKMHAILSRPDLTDVVTWMEHGRSWRVLKPREFEIRVIPTYFEHQKFSSFIRQANGWGFRRIAQGRDRNSYYHELFLRGVPHLCKKMKRPGVSKKVTVDSEHEPDFYKIAETHPLPTKASDGVEENILLPCTLLGGPKARMPVTIGPNKDLGANLEKDNSGKEHDEYNTVCHFNHANLTTESSHEVNTQAVKHFAGPTTVYDNLNVKNNDSKSSFSHLNLLQQQWQLLQSQGNNPESSSPIPPWSSSNWDSSYSTVSTKDQTTQDPNMSMNNTNERKNFPVLSPSPSSLNSYTLPHNFNNHNVSSIASSSQPMSTIGSVAHQSEPRTQTHDANKWNNEDSIPPIQKQQQGTATSAALPQQAPGDTNNNLSMFFPTPQHYQIPPYAAAAFAANSTSNPHTAVAVQQAAASALSLAMTGNTTSYPYTNPYYCHGAQQSHALIDKPLQFQAMSKQQQQQQDPQQQNQQQQQAASNEAASQFAAGFAAATALNDCRMRSVLNQAMAAGSAVAAMRAMYCNGNATNVDVCKNIMMGTGVPSSHLPTDTNSVTKTLTQSGDKTQQ